MIRNIFLIARREYLQRVRTKAFIISTVLMPLLMTGWLFVPGLMMSRSSGPKKVALVTDDPALAAALEKQFAEQASQPDANLRARLDSVVAPEQESQVRSRVEAKQLDGYVVITKKAIADRKLTFYALETSDFIASSGLESAVNSAMRKERLQARGFSPEEIESLFDRIPVDTVSLAGASGRRGFAAFMTPFALTFVLYLVLIIYGVQVMQSVVEEKSSRVMEVMLASATPKEMMGGKVLGVGAVAMTQLLIWMIVPIIGSAIGIAAFANRGLAALGLGFGLFAAMLVFFLLGFILYSTLFASIGAAVNSVEETQQLSWIVTMPIIIAFMLVFMAIRQPNAPLVVGLSLVPLFTPIVMFARIAVQTPPAWQIGLSILLTLGFIYLLVVICGRIYRIGILMYGKRPTLPEIVKWLRYA